MQSRMAVLIALVFALTVAGCGGDHARVNQTGLDAYRAGEYEKARGAFTLAIEYEPKMGNYYFNCGMAEQALGNLDRALADYGLAVKLAPSIVAAYQAMAQCYIEKGQPDVALEALVTGARANPYTADPYINVAAFHLARGDLDSAKLWLAKATEAEPQSARAHYQYGLLLARTGEHAKAVEEFQKSLEIDPVQPEVSAKLTELAPTGRQLPEPKPQP